MVAHPTGPATRAMSYDDCARKMSADEGAAGDPPPPSSLATDAGNPLLATPAVTGAGGSSPPPTPEGSPRWRRVRWIGAFIIVAISVGADVLSYWYAPFRICREVATSTIRPLPVSCSPWAAVDLAPPLIVSLVLIFPELGELTIANVLSLKRKAEAQQSQINATVSRQNDLELRLISQISTMNSAQSVTQHFYSGPVDAANLPEEVAREEEAAQFGLSGRRTDAAQGTGQQDEEANRRNALIVDLLFQWDQIDLRVNPRRSRDRIALSPRQESQVADFLERHRPSIATIRSVRNSVAHAHFVATDAISGAVDAAKKLNRMLDSYDIPPF